MKITINGEEQEVAEGATVMDLLVLLQLKPERLAVELNRRIIRRANWEQTTIAAGDRVEIVQFVGGGSLA